MVPLWLVESNDKYSTEYVLLSPTFMSTSQPTVEIKTNYLMCFTGSDFQKYYVKRSRFQIVDEDRRSESG